MVAPQGQLKTETVARCKGCPLEQSPAPAISHAPVVQAYPLPSAPDRAQGIAHTGDPGPAWTLGPA